MSVIQKTSNKVVKKVIKPRASELKQATINSFFNKSNVNKKHVVNTTAVSYLNVNSFDSSDKNNEDVELNEEDHVNNSEWQEDNDQHFNASEWVSEDADLLPNTVVLTMSR